MVRSKEGIQETRQASIKINLISQFDKSSIQRIENDKTRILPIIKMLETMLSPKVMSKEHPKTFNKIRAKIKGIISVRNVNYASIQNKTLVITYTLIHLKMNKLINLNI